MTVLAIFLCLILLLTWTYIRTALLAGLIRIDRAQAGTLEDKVSGEAVFAGGSVLVAAPAPGSVRLLVKDRESVRMGQVIAEIGGQETAQAFQDSLAFARGRLAEYEAGTDGEFRALADRLQSAYEKAVGLFFRIQKAYASGDVPGVRRDEEELRAVESDLLSQRDRLTAMEDERARLQGAVAGIEAAKKSSSVQVLAPASGVFSVEVTTVDSKFTLSAVSGKDASQLTDLIREARDAKGFTVKDGQRVNAGDAIGNVISGQKVTFFLPVKTEERPDVKPGRQITVFLGSSAQAEEALITEVIDGKPPGYSIIAGEIPVLSAERLTKSGVLSLLVKSRSGLVIPGSAVIEKDGKTGVLAVQKTYARFVPVEVLMVKDNKAVVRGILESDEILVRAMRFLEGKRVR